MTTQLLSPLESIASLERLSIGLVTHLAQSGMPVPEDECVLDYIKSAMRFGNMRALLAVRQDEAVGAVAWRVEADTGFVVLLYVLPDADQATAGSLVEAVMADLSGRVGLRSIVAELPDVPPEVQAAFARMGFVGVKRDVMQCHLGGDTLAQPLPVAMPDGYRLAAWQDAHLEVAATVIYRANVGTVDAMIIPELQTIEETTRILEQSLRGRFGAFDRHSSGVVLDSQGVVVGVTLVTRRHGGMGFTAEICVLPEHRRKGIARALMLHTHQTLLVDGVQLNTLGVTLGNPARHLYTSLGYTPLGSVWTYVWPCPDAWPFSKPGASNS